MNTNSKQEFIQGKWFKINKKIKKRITARYDKIKDWVMDPKGYFLIDVDKEKIYWEWVIVKLLNRVTLR